VTREEVQALLVRRIAAWKARDAPTLSSLHDASGVVISPTGGVLEGRDEIERIYRVWFSAFPDMTTHDDVPLIDGDRAVQILRFAGTHAGEFFGLPATGRHVELTVACVLSLADDKIVEERRIYDFTGLLVQVGVLKAKPQV
jgi:predicted ester cyclase